MYDLVDMKLARRIDNGDKSQIWNLWHLYIDPLSPHERASHPLVIFVGLNLKEVEDVYRELAIPVAVDVAMEEYLYLHGGMLLCGLDPLVLPPLLKSSVDWIYPHPSFWCLVFYRCCLSSYFCSYVSCSNSILL